MGWLIFLTPRPCQEMVDEYFDRLWLREIGVRP